MKARGGEEKQSAAEEEERIDKRLKTLEDHHILGVSQNGKILGGGRDYILRDSTVSHT